MVEQVRTMEKQKDDFGESQREKNWVVEMENRWEYQPEKRKGLRSGVRWENWKVMKGQDLVMNSAQHAER